MLLIISGRSVKEICRELNYSRSGIYKVIYRLRRQYNAANDAQLALAYARGQTNAH